MRKKLDEKQAGGGRSRRFDFQGKTNPNSAQKAGFGKNCTEFLGADMEIRAAGN